MTENQFYQMSFRELAELYEKTVPMIRGVYIGGSYNAKNYGITNNKALMKVIKVSEVENAEIYVEVLKGGNRGAVCSVPKCEFYPIPKPLAELLIEMDIDELEETMEETSGLLALLEDMEDQGFNIADDFFEECLEELRKHGFTFSDESKPTTSKLNFMEEKVEKPISMTKMLADELAKTSPKKVKTTASIETQHKTTTEIIPQKENNSMFKSMNFLKGFDSIDTSKVKMTMFGIGVENSQGIVQTYNALTHELTDVTDFVMDGFGGMDNMVFVFPAQKVKKGDLVVFNKNFCFVTGIQGKRITAVDFNTNQEVTIVKQKHAMGFNFVPKVMCPFGNMFTATEKDPVGGFESMLPMMMMMNMGKGDSDVKGGMSGMMEMMMMSQMFGGSGENPFAKMFGGMSADEEEETTEE